MKFKFNKRLSVLVLALIFLIFSILSIQDTYARYVTALNTTSYVELGSWSIKIKEQNIMDNADFSSQLEPIFNTDSDYIAENKIVPTSTGHIELLLDYSEVKVPFQYTLTFSPDDTTYIEDVKLTNVLVNNLAATYTASGLTNTIIPDGVTTTQTFTFDFAWVDDTGELDDSEDTKASRDFENIKLNFNISFTQLTS